MKRYKRKTKLIEEELDKIYANAKEFTDIFHEINYYIAKQNMKNT